MTPSATYAESLHEAASFLREHDNYLVVSHLQPDGDAASSTCAVGWMLTQLGKQYTMMNEGAIPAKFHFLYQCEQILNYSNQKPTTTFDAIIFVDCADIQRVGKVAELFPSQAQYLNIDHHSTNNLYGTVNVVKRDAAATVEVLYDLIETLKLPWSNEIAECIYAGLLTDTGGFRYTSTSPKVMEIASRLLNLGVQGAKLAEELLEKTSFAHIQLLKLALNSMGFSADRRVAWLTVTLEDLRVTGATNDDTEGLVNYSRNIEGVEVGILFKQQAENEVKISLRSSGSVDVSRIAQQFGGGGHIKASGATFKGEMAAAIQEVVAAIEGALP